MLLAVLAIGLNEIHRAVSDWFHILLQSEPPKQYGVLEDRDGSSPPVCQHEYRISVHESSLFGAVK